MPATRTRWFVTEDPIRDGINWYEYVNNRPLTHVDPTGPLTDQHRGIISNLVDNEVGSDKIGRVRSKLENKERQHIDQSLSELSIIQNSPDFNDQEYSRRMSEIENQMGLYNRDIEYNSQSWAPNSEQSQGFGNRLHRLKQTDGTYISYTHPGVDLVGGSSLSKPLYVKRIRTRDDNSGETDVMTLQIVGSNNRIRMLHLNPGVPANVSIGSILKPGRISDFSVLNEGSGPHLHLEETALNSRGIRGFVNPDTHSNWTPGTKFGGSIEIYDRREIVKIGNSYSLFQDYSTVRSWSEWTPR